MCRAWEPVTGGFISTYHIGGASIAPHLTPPKLSQDRQSRFCGGLPLIGQAAVEEVLQGAIQPLIPLLLVCALYVCRECSKVVNEALEGGSCTQAIHTAKYSKLTAHT